MGRMKYCDSVGMGLFSDEEENTEKESNHLGLTGTMISCKSHNTKGWLRRRGLIQRARCPSFPENHNQCPTVLDATSKLLARARRLCASPVRRISMLSRELIKGSRVLDGHHVGKYVSSSREGVVQSLWLILV